MVDNGQQKMKQKTKIDLRFVQVNSTFIWPLYSEDGDFIVGSRVPLTKNMLTRIQERYGRFVYFITDVNQEEGASEAVAATSHDYEMIIEQAGAVIEEIISTQKVTPKTIYDTEEVIDILIQNLENRDTQVVSLLQNLNRFEDYIKQHLVNVSILTFLFAKRFGRYSREDLKYIMLGALLLDIGLVKIDDKLRNKEGEFTASECQIMKRHPQLGYELLKPLENVNPIVLQIVLFHHERANGKGYYELPYETLPDVVKLVSVCDVYDALTSQRPYREAYSASHAQKVLFNLVDIQFERHFIQTFVNKVGPRITGESSFYEENDIVELDTGEIALIKQKAHHNLLEPSVSIFGKFERETGGRPRLRFNPHSVEVNLESDPSRALYRFITNTKQAESIKSVLKAKKLL